MRMLLLSHIKVRPHFAKVQVRSRHECHSDTHLDSAFRYAPDTDAILILIQTQHSDIIQIHSRHGCHLDIYSDSTFDTVQIRFRYECHPDTHSDSTLRYSSDTLQTRMPF
ncbi:unnamed protein product [Vicia faba]|uniref:Uncharacterized protein n=1 Tax=Vicia faba TaxID=3906 RepID=A0AAV0ZP87_VICFA|nr:unnamed protein product [Vicia faba]